MTPPETKPPESKPAPKIVTWFGKDQREWATEGGKRVFYTPNMDGGGTVEAGWYLNFFREYLPGRKFRKAFEWCSGPGFIGFSLLDAGICEKLCVADLNDEAIKCARQTVEANQWQDRVSCYTSDNFKQIPEHEQFDLVVANPPYFKHYNKKYILHPSQPLRGSDPDWQLHKDFYANVGRYLAPDAVLCISEFRPLEGPLPSAGPFGPHDLREYASIGDFMPMIEAAGLKLKQVVRMEGEPLLEQMTKNEKPRPADYLHGSWMLVIERAR